MPVLPVRRNIFPVLPVRRIIIPVLPVRRIIMPVLPVRRIIIPALPVGRNIIPVLPVCRIIHKVHVDSNSWDLWYAELNPKIQNTILKILRNVFLSHYL